MALDHRLLSFTLCSFIFSNSLHLFSQAVDTLRQGQSLPDGETLVSPGGVFVLGFFSPGSSTNRYVGIWYANISTQTVVWVANREAPLSKSTGVLTIGSQGDLVILDEGGGVPVWSTDLSSSTSNFTAQLLDSGDLVLQDSHGVVLWESFDHPTDTFLPGMKISLNLRTGKNLTYTSWNNPNDPSVGNYSIGLDPSGSGQLFLWDGTVPKWRSGQWNGEQFIGIMMRPLYIYGFKLTNDISQGLMYFTYTQYNSSLLRFQLQWNGVENASILVEETRDWETVFAQPDTECQIYAKCGAYGICSDVDKPICSCLKGYMPSEGWKNGNWSAGCVRRTRLACETNSSGDGFFKVSGVKLPDLADWGSTIGSASGCLTACSNNCSCKAYAYITGVGCMMWEHDLIDISQFTQGGNDLYIKLAVSELGKKSKSRITTVTLSTLGIVFLVICLLLWKFNAKLKDCWKKEKNKKMILSKTPSITSSRADFSGPSLYGMDDQENDPSDLQLFTFNSILTATNEFSDANKLGEGGFGHVYKGILPGGNTVAVKRLSRSSGQGLEEFKNEVVLIAKLQHRNLVRLLGCCIQREEKLLIYEYMPNKSLDAFLFDPLKKSVLDWKMRYSIVEGIARGLLYLHRDSRLRVVHRDLKASNVLLDDDMNPKISDFGMARIFGGGQNQDITNRVVGTFGYMSPEYAMEGVFSDKSDVYSFGILVLEIVTGRRNSSFFKENHLNIVGYTWQFWNEDKAAELIDPSIRPSCSMNQVLRSIHIALLCVQDRANDRPDMQDVIIMLSSHSGILPMPKIPIFTSEGSLYGSETGVSKIESFSTHNLTVTMLLGR